MDAAAQANMPNLERARAIARTIAIQRKDKTCHADDVRRVMVATYGPEEGTMGAEAGSIFRGEEWEFTGKWVRSENVKNHGRHLMVWRLVDSVPRTGACEVP